MERSHSDTDELRKRFYFDYQKQLWAGRQASFAEFDRALLSLSSGALALSLTFIKDVVPVSQAFGLPLLFGSWVLFLASIVCTLYSFIMSRKAYDLQLELAHDYYLEKNNAAFDKENSYGRMTDRLNKSAGLFFVLALLATLLFVGPNLWMAAKIDPVSKSNDGPELSIRQVNEGAVPPAMARVPLENRGSVPVQMPKVPQQAPTQPAPAATPPADPDKK